MATPSVVAACVLVALGSLPAQGVDDLPTEREQILPSGGLIDLDSGLVMGVKALRPWQADLRFDRDGAGFHVESLHGGIRAQADDVEPPAGEWSTGRMRMNTRMGELSVTVFARTDRGVARATLTLLDLYGAGTAVLRWVVLPAKSAVFLPPPVDLLAEWQGPQLVVSWQGDGTRWLVEVQRSDQATDKHVVAQRRIALDGLDAEGRYRVRVRRLDQDTLSVPAEVVQHGRRQVPRRGVVELAMGAAAGMRLSVGESAVEDAEVIFYPYGVYVPGGGVVKVGKGERAFAELVALPSGNRLPIHGQLDSDDVLAVCLPDGRHGKLWLTPSKGNHLLDGIRVHYVFLADGRRHLQAAPAEVKPSSTDGVVVLQWQRPAGAVRYRLLVPGRAPIETAEPSARIEGLPARQLFTVELVAIDAHGEESMPARTFVHTHGTGARVGSAVLTHQGGGFEFASGISLAPGLPGDLALVGSAGSGQSLTFQAAGGILPGDGREFGDFAGDRPDPVANELRSDQRDSGSDHFYVHTAGGGRASVRIKVRALPETTIEYVWLPGKQ